MKKLTFLICLLLTGHVWAYGTAKEDTSTAITFVHSIGMDSVRYYAGQDTSSWEINRLMARAFSGDSTNYALVDTFDNPGTYFVKIEYWEGGAASAKYLPDIRHVAPANYGIDWANISNQTTSVNLTQTKVGTATALGSNAVNNSSVADDIHFDSLSLRTLTIINTSTNDPTVYIESDSSKAIHAYTDDAGGNPAVQFEAFGGASYGLQLMGATGDLNATLNIDDLTGDFATTDFEDSVFNAIKFDTDYYDTLSQIIIDNAAAGSTDTTIIKRMIYNNFRIMPEDKKVRFIDDDGSDADGLTPATAWTDFSKVEDSTGYTFYVFPGTYADAVCKITKSNVDLISVEPMGATFLRNADDTLKANTIIQLNPDQDEGIITNIRIIGFNFAYKVSYTTLPPDPGFQAAIWAFDSVSYVEIANCFFVPDSNYKSIAVEDVETKYYYIHDNHFVRNYTHAIDFAGDFSIIENNTIIDQRGYLGGASGANTTVPVLITTNGEHNVIRGNYINYGSVLIRLQGDNTLVAGNYLGYSVANDGRWIEGYAVGADTAQQNVAAGNWSRAFTPDTSGAGSKLDSLSTVSEDLENIYNTTSAGGGGSGAFSCSLFAYNSGWAPNGGSPAITSGSIRMISGVNEYVLSIDANGWVEFSLDGGTWSAYATALRFIQDTIPQTITFSTHHVDTITMSAFSPSTPTDTGKVNLYIWTDEILGDTLEGAIFRVIPLDKGKNWVTGGNRTLLLGEVTKKTDSTGYAEIEVYQSSFTHPYPSGSDSLKYNISITYPGLSSWAQFRFIAPDSGSQYQIGVR